MSAKFARHDAYWQKQDRTAASSTRDYPESSRTPIMQTVSQEASVGTAGLQSKASEAAESNSTTPAVMVPTLSSVAYFTPAQLEQLYSRERGSKMSASKWQTNRILATGFIQATASRLGFPQRTIATAQQVYQRFHLFYPPSEFVLHELAVTSLFVAAKLNDTPKKAREILLASYALRFPQLVKGASSDSDQTAASNTRSGANEDITFPTLAGQKRKAEPTILISDTQSDQAGRKEEDLLRMTSAAIGNVSEGDIDPSILETDRKRLMALEKLVLKSLCFNFHLKSNVALKMVIKLGRVNKLPKSFLRTAWKFAADMHRTPAPLLYPPNVIAMASLYTAALMSSPPKQGGYQDPQHSEDSDPVSLFIRSLQPPLPPEQASETLRKVEQACHVYIEDVEEAMHELLDLYLTCVTQLPPSLFMQNPVGTATPSPHSPADPLEIVTSSPSSSTGLSESSVQQGAIARRKLKQYEYAPPPFGVVDWLNTRRGSQLLDKQANSSVAASAAATNPVLSTASDPTLPAKELSALLTDLKIYLRGVEFDRQKRDDSLLASLGILAQVRSNLLAPVASSASNPSDAPAATSVTISLNAIVEQKGADTNQLQAQKLFDESSLQAKDRDTVARISRRKLTTSLRTIFVEPDVVLKTDPLPSSHNNNDADSAAAEEKQGQNGTTASAQTHKRMRIDHATRYIF